MFLGHQSI